jgi:hypothetical protein
VNLPTFTTMTDEQVERVASVIQGMADEGAKLR